MRANALSFDTLLRYKVQYPVVGHGRRRSPKLDSDSVAYSVVYSSRMKIVPTNTHDHSQHAKRGCEHDNHSESFIIRTSLIKPIGVGKGRTTENRSIDNPWKMR